MKFIICARPSVIVEELPVIKVQTRLAVVNSHPIQYFAPLYAFLTGTGEIEVTALYCSDSSLRGTYDVGFMRPVRWDIDLLAGYKSVFLGARARERVPRGFWSLICPELAWEISPSKYDALIVHGTQYAAYILAAIIGKLKGIPTLHRCETTVASFEASKNRWLRKRLLRLYYRLFDGFLAIGTENRMFYEACGIPASRIYLVPYTVDNLRFMAASKISLGERLALRKRFALLDDVPVVLYVSKLIRRKRPDDLLRAVAILQAEGVKVQLLFVGAGEMRAELERLVAEIRVTAVRFAGFVNQAELPAILAAGDIFVLPSENEPWGLIVNEAMCARLPIIAAQGVGCAADLVEDGVSGRIVAPRNPGLLANALRELVLSPRLREAMGAESMARIMKWGYEECRRGIQEALEGALGRDSSRRA